MRGRAKPTIVCQRAAALIGEQGPEQGELDVLFVVHLLGLNALSHEVLETASRHDVVVVEDCWHHLSTIEGGMVCSDDPELLDELRLLRAHGMARESAHYEALAARHTDVDPRFLFVAPGLNLRSTDANALLGLRQLEGLDATIRRRNENLARLVEGAPPWVWSDYALDGASSFALPLVAADGDGSRRVRDVTAELGIETRPIVAGNLLAQPFVRESRAVRAAGPTPVADHIHAHGLYVGNGPHVTPAMVDTLLGALWEAGARPPRRPVEPPGRR